MLQPWINCVKIWYCNRDGEVDAVDENGDYTGEYVSSYGKPKTIRANISPARGESQSELFGQGIYYSNTLSTTHMHLDINEQTLIWTEEPGRRTDGSIDPETARYKVNAIAKGHYHVHYALKELTRDAEDD